MSEGEGEGEGCGCGRGVKGEGTKGRDTDKCAWKREDWASLMPVVKT